jgi:hypothetical protein
VRPSVLGVLIAICCCVGLLLALEPAGAPRRGARTPAELPIASPRAPAAGPPVEAPIGELRLVENPPEDPLPSGECTLLLRLVDADSGEPIREWVDLWQLDAPGNEDWTRGDQRRFGKIVPKTGLRVAGLPEGRYRIFCDHQRASAEDPPAFAVAGSCTDVVVVVPRPRIFEVRLRIYSASGHPIRDALRVDRGYSDSRATRVPEWVRPRELRDGFAAESCPAIASCCYHPGTPRPVAAASAGFHVGRVLEDQRRNRKETDHAFLIDGLCPVRLKLRGDVARNRTYVGVAVPEEPLRACVLLPDGARATTAGARVAVFCRARLDRSWYEIPVTVRAWLEGYEDLEFEVLPGEAPRPHRLVPKR